MRWPDGVTCKRFSGRGESGSETWIAVLPDADGDFESQLQQIETRYRGALDAFGLSEEDAVFRRVFASDVINQAPILRESWLCGRSADNPVASSLIQQPPLPGRKLSLLAYHVSGSAPLNKLSLGRNSLLVEHGGSRHLWTTGLCAHRNDPGADSYWQTRRVFGELINGLDAQGGRLRENCMRTWIYLKNVDTYYAGMVEARGDIFERYGMTGEGHSIASTGIEGACADRYDVVVMDAYSNLDLMPEQVRYLNDFAHLCPTQDYNVHFERATRIAYDDRAHIFISGTASIDHQGEVLHPCSVKRQFDRAMENVEGLLNDGGATLADMMHMIVYLRDPSDYAAIAARLQDRNPAIPAVVVQGAVCRPQWLVEVEGIAIAPNNDPGLPAF